MSKTVEFCFDIVSPAAYIAWQVLPRIAESAGAEIVYRPIFLGGLMEAAGNRPPMTCPNKGKWMGGDLARWAAKYGIDYRRNDKFPQMTLHHMRGAVALQDEPVFVPYVSRMYRAIHAENQVIDDPANMAKLLAEVGVDGQDFMARIGDQAIKDRLKANTDSVCQRGGFGAPTFFIGETMHFGQDRLWMVAEDLGTTLDEPA